MSDNIKKSEIKQFRLFGDSEVSLLRKGFNYSRKGSITADNFFVVFGLEYKCMLLIGVMI